MTASDRLLVDMVIGSPVENVWSALREPDRIAGWFGWDDEGLPAEIEEIFVTGPEVDDDARTLHWADDDRIEVHEDEPGLTRLTVHRRGHAESFDGAYDAVDEGWITFTQQLRFGLERHPDQARRTVSAIGVDLGPEDDPLLDRLGLRPLGDDPVGGGYSVNLPDGGDVHGEVFFQTDLQLGLSVAEERDALLVVARTPPTSAPPNGTVMFVLSTYGLDDEAFADAERRWTAWWGQGTPQED